MTRMEPRSWLLGTGEVVNEPALEMTSSGRKVRVVGTTSSVYANEVDDLLSQAVKGVAAAKNTNVWVDITTGVGNLIQNQYAWSPSMTKAQLHLVHKPTDTGANTIVWWRFKDPSTPFEVLLSITMQPMNRHGSVNGQNITVELGFLARTYYGEDIRPQVYKVTDKFAGVIDNLRYLDQNLTYKWQEFLRDNPQDWFSALGSNNHQHARVAVQSLLKLVRELDDLEEIKVPDLGDPYNPSYRTLELYDTNVNAELLSDLTEYLDGAPTIEQAADLYGQMLATLRSIGINVQGKTPNDFMAALLAGEKSTLNMQVFALAEENQGVDTDHTLSVHLPTGAFIVECSHRGVDKDVVAEKWEEALTMASLTGQENELLAYARKYAEGHSTRRTKAILKERQA